MHSSTTFARIKSILCSVSRYGMPNRSIGYHVVVAIMDVRQPCAQAPEPRMNSFDESSSKRESRKRTKKQPDIEISWQEMATCSYIALGNAFNF